MKRLFAALLCLALGLTLVLSLRSEPDGALRALCQWDNMRLLSIGLI